MPQVEVSFCDKTINVDDGDASARRQFPLNGNIVAGLDATIIASFDTILAVPSMDFLGGTLAVGLTLPLGAPIVDADAVLTGPGGGRLGKDGRESCRERLCQYV